MNEVHPSPSALVFDPSLQQWLCFRDPSRIFLSHHQDEVLPLLETIDQAVSKEGMFAAGFVSYEAAPGLNPNIKTRSLTDFPLLWFGIFQHVTPVYPDFSSQLGPDSQPHWTASIHREQYYQAIHQIRSLIEAGDTYQSNFTYRLQAAFHANPRCLFNQMIMLQGNGYGAYLDLGRWVIASASPELFFRLDGNHIVTRPMKGTARRGLWPQQDHQQAHHLVRDPKNRAENLMIVDMARHDLGQIADTGSVHVAQLFAAERYPTIWQLTSTIEAKTHATIPEIFQAMFPAASITGAPKVRTTEILRDIETTPRKVYTGAIGFIAPGRKAQFNVAIRTAVLDLEKHHIEYGVGGGIVWDSRADSEFEECLTKARILEPVPPAFALLESIRWSPIEQFCRLNMHLERLTDSADYFGFTFHPQSLRKRLADIAPKLPPQPHKIRVLLATNGTLTLEYAPIQPWNSPIRCRLAQSAVDPSNRFLYHKTTNRSVYDAALAHRSDADEALLWNQRGELTEFCRGNLFAEIDGTLLTPPIEVGLLPGTLRRELLESHRAQEHTLTIKDLSHSPRIFFGNSVRGLIPAVLVAP